MLLLGQNYTVGRDNDAHFEKYGEDLDFLFHSGRVAKEYLTIAVGTTLHGNINQKTTLQLCIKSRAKAYINGEIYRLKQKGDPKQDIDFTNESRIVIASEKDLKNNIVDEPLIIEWVDLRLYIGTRDKFVEQLIHLQLDICFVDDIKQATHYYTNKTVPDLDEFRVAIIKGTNIVNEAWIRSLLEDADKLVWLNVKDNLEFLPNGDLRYLLQLNRVKTLENHKVISFEKILWLDTIIVSRSKEVIEHEVGENEFILVAPSSEFGFEAIEQNILFNRILTNQLDQIPRNKVTLASLKRPATTSPEKRKRRKYEKVDKLHFFSLGDVTPVQSIPKEKDDEEEIENEREKAKEKGNEMDAEEGKEIKEKENGNEKGKEKNDLVEVQKKQRHETNNSESIEYNSRTLNGLDSITTKNTSNTTSSITNTATNELKKSSIVVKREDSSPKLPNLDNGNNSVSSKKRKNEYNSTTENAPKIAKFVPKVSLIDAVIQAKEQAVKTLNKELGVSDDFYERKDETEGDDEQTLLATKKLSNLAIVEVVDKPLRQRPAVPIEVSSTQKNFKRFHKNKPPKSKIERPQIEMINVGAFSPVKSKKKVTVDSEFNGIMSSVRGFTPSTLFVQDDESGAESSEEKERGEDYEQVAPSFQEIKDYSRSQRESQARGHSRNGSRGQPVRRGLMSQIGWGNISESVNEEKQEQEQEEGQEKEKEDDIDEDDDGDDDDEEQPKFGFTN